MSVGIRQGLDREQSHGASGAPPAHAREPRLTAAVQLGWRIAELYAQVNDTGEPCDDTLLPAHGSLEPEDQLELQLRAAAGDARRAGIVAQRRSLDQLLSQAREAPNSPEAAEAFRRDVRCCHIGLQKELWAQDEAAGRAYELGNGMSDTYSRISRAYRERDEEPATAWRRVFARERIKRLQRLLDDLQSRLDSGGVAVVRNHLDAWRDEVPKRIRAAGGPPTEESVRQGLRRQTVAWRQLIAGDKEPEAYLDSEARAEVRGEMRRLVWSRYRRWVLPGAALLFTYVFFFPQLLGWYEENLARTGLASATMAIAAAFGITKASVLLTVRTRTQQWSELLWNQALIEKVGEQTMMLDSVFPPPRTEPRSLADVARALRKHAKGRTAPRSSPLRRPQTEP